MGSRAKDLEKFTNDFRKEYFKNKYELKPIKESEKEDKMSTRPVSGIPPKPQEGSPKAEKDKEEINVDEIDQRFENYFKNLDTKQYDVLKPSGSQKSLPGADPDEPREDDPMRMTSNLDGLDLEITQNTKALDVASFKE